MAGDQQKKNDDNKERFQSDEGCDSTAEIVAASFPSFRVWKDAASATFSVCRKKEETANRCLRIDLDVKSGRLIKLSLVCAMTVETKKS